VANVSKDPCETQGSVFVVLAPAAVGWDFVLIAKNLRKRPKLSRFQDSNQEVNLVAVVALD